MLRCQHSQVIEGKSIILQHAEVRPTRDIGLEARSRVGLSEALGFRVPKTTREIVMDLTIFLTTAVVATAVVLCVYLLARKGYNKIEIMVGRFFKFVTIKNQHTSEQIEEKLSDRK